MKLSTIAITGASAGIGAAIAKRFSKEGFCLILLARRKDKLEEIKKEIGTKDVHTFELDVTSRKGVEKTFKEVEKRVGPIDILVNNAGSAFGLDRAQEASIEDWEKCVSVNINGILYCTHAVLPGMVQRNRGHIINMGSIAGTYPYPGGNVYSGTKAFVHQFSLSLRADLLGKRVRVSCIEPGLLGGTEFSVVRFRGDTTKAQTLYEKTEPLKAEDIAEIAYFTVKLPERININTIEVMPVFQASQALAVHKS